MRIVYTPDLHGGFELYRAAGAAVAQQADALILGGDFCPGTPSASAVRLPRAQPEFLRTDWPPFSRHGALSNHNCGSSPSQATTTARPFLRFSMN
jgi:hypothetical protein